MKKIFLLLVAVFSFILVGCGGSGGSGAESGASNLNVFITDDLNAGYDNVWVTIYEINLVRPGNSTTVFSSTDGVQVDLRALNDGNSLFQFLGAADVPAGAYVSAEVLMDKSLVLFPTGASTGTAAEFEDSFDSGVGLSLVPVPFSSPQNINGNASLVLDFDLSQWTLNAGKVNPEIVRDDGNGLSNLQRHYLHEIEGTIVGLNGNSPNQAFVLRIQQGRNFRVVLDADTIVYRGDGNGDASLANGQRAEVYGRFDTTRQAFVASRVKIKDSSGNGNEDKVKGDVVEGTSTSDGFEVTTTFVRGFLPMSDTIQVSYNGSTTFFGAGGQPVTKSEFLVLLETAQSVEVEGNATGNGTGMLAKKVKIEDGEDGGQEAKGYLISSNAGDGTFVLDVREWYGFNFTLGGSLNVSTTANTRFRDQDGDDITSQQFFAALDSGVGVKVEGTFSEGGFAATQARLRGELGQNDEDEAKGSVTASNETNGTLSLNLVSWFGFEGSLGLGVQVQMLNNAEYRVGNVDTNKAEFFANLSNGSIVEVEGVFNGTTFQAVKAKIED